MQFKAVNNRVLLTQWNKKDKDNSGNNPFGSLHTNSQIAEVAYFDEALLAKHPWLKKGLKVVYGKEQQAVYVEGNPLISMDISNIMMVEQEDSSNVSDEDR